MPTASSGAAGAHRDHRRADRYSLRGPGTELNFRYGAGLLIVSSFFFLGVTFWWALLCAVLIVVADVLIAGLILTPEQMPEHWIAVSYYLLLLIIGAISRYVHEYSQRDQFLMRKLLGWVAEHDALSGLANRRSHDRRCDSGSPGAPGPPAAEPAVARSG